MEELLAQLLLQRATQTKAQSDATTLAALAPRERMPTAPSPQSPKTPDTFVQRRVPGFNTPVLETSDALSREQVKSDISARAERGQDVPEWMMQGLGADDIINALGYGGAMRGFGGDPLYQPMSEPEAPSFVDPVYRPQPTAEHVRLEKARMVDDFVAREGWKPELFSGKTDMDAVRLIADQLQARRELLGDDSAWVHALATGI